MPGQLEFIAARERFLNYMAGRGYGKTHAEAARIVTLCTKYPGFKYRYMTPLYKQGEDVFDAICNNDCYLPFIHQIKKRPYPQIFFKGPNKIKSECIFRSLQRPEGLRGDIADEICLDESQSGEVKEESISSIIMPILSRRIALHGNGQRGTLVMAGQFRGEDFRYSNYWIKGMPYAFATDVEGVPLFDRGLHRFDKTKPNPLYDKNYRSWAFPSSEGWSYKIQPGGVDELRMMRDITRKAAFEQEYLCLPRANANAAFDAGQLNQVIGNRHKSMELFKRGNGGYVAGIDPGKKTDPTKLVIQHNSGDVVWIEEYPLGQEHAVSARKAATTAARYGAACVVDCTGGMQGGHGIKLEAVELYRSEIQRVGLAFHAFYWSEQNKNRIIENLDVDIQQKKISIPPDATGLISEMKAYEYQYNQKTKRYYYGAPVGQHDDYVAALATAWDGILTGKVPTGNRYGGMI